MHSTLLAAERGSQTIAEPPCMCRPTVQNQAQGQNNAPVQPRPPNQRQVRPNYVSTLIPPTQSLGDSTLPADICAASGSHIPITAGARQL